MHSRLPRPVGRPRARLHLNALECRDLPSGGLGALAIADPDGSGAPSIIASTAPGVPASVEVYYGGSGSTNMAVPDGTVNDVPTVYLPAGTVTKQLSPFEGTFTGGMSVAVGDFDGDGYQDIALGAGVGGGPRVQVYDGITGQLVVDQYVFDSSFTGGVSLAADDLDSDGVAELIVAAGQGGGPHVQVLDVANGGFNTVASFYAYDKNFTGGVSLATGKLVNRQNDGHSYLVVGAGVGGAPHVQVYDLSDDTPTVVASFYAGDVNSRAGVTVATVTGEYIDGTILTTPATVAATASPDVTLHRVTGLGSSGGLTFTTPQTVTLGDQHGTIALAGGGFVFPESPIFFAGAIGSKTVVAYGVNEVDGRNVSTQKIANDTTSPQPGTLMTVSDFNLQVGGKSTINVTPPAAHGNALGAFSVLDPSTVTTQTLGKPGTPSAVSVPVVGGFIPLTMIPAPPVDYVSPYSIVTTLTGLEEGFDTTPRNDPSSWIVSGTGADGYGPDAIKFTVSESVADQTAEWQAQRLATVAEKFLGIHYQHHHVPTWVPDLTAPWNPVFFVPRQVPGVDCSNFTSFVYNYGLGIKLSGDVGTQSGQTSVSQLVDVTNADGTTTTETRTIPIVNTPVTTPKDQRDDKFYEELTGKLQPGDLLYIQGTGPGESNIGADPGTPAHVIMWLGSLGKDANGQDKYLVVDSTGYEHIDSNGVHVPDGIHIRPFVEDGANGWYFKSLQSYSRIIPTQAAPTSGGSS